MLEHSHKSSKTRKKHQVQKATIEEIELTLSAFMVADVTISLRSLRRVRTDYDVVN
jgi:hypothetical protein